MMKNKEMEEKPGIYSFYKDLRNKMRKLPEKSWVSFLILTKIRGILCAFFLVNEIDNWKNL